MITTHVELEELETKAEQLQSCLLILEQSLYNDEFRGATLAPAVTLMEDTSVKLVRRIKELKAKYTKLHEEEQKQ